MNGPLAQITGVAESGVSFESGRSAIELAAQAALDAVADAGRTLDDIDGLAVSKGADLAPADQPSLELADYLGMTIRYSDTTLAGGASPLVQICHAIDAIALGRCRRVLVVYSSVQASRKERSLGGHRRADTHHIAPFERPSGLPFPIGVNALAAARHMWEYGTTLEQLAAVAISDRTWATRNPGALVRTPLSPDEAAASPVISSPLRKIDCCLISDGAGAVLVEAAESTTARSVGIAGFSDCHRQYSVLSAPSLTTTNAARTGPEAMGMAGVTINDIGLVQLYDAFTILPIVLLEDLGFCEKGRGGPFVQDGHTLPGGRLPMNTQGGGLAHAHPGFYGIFLAIEAVRQLRGEAGERQVPDPRVGLCHAAGGGAFGGSQVSIVMGGPG